MKFLLKDVRLAFPNIWTPRAATPGAEPKFSATFIFPSDHPQMKELTETLVSVAKDKWGEHAMQKLQQFKASDRLPIRDGDGKAQYAGFAGNRYINASSKVRPRVLGGGPDGRAPLVEDDGKPYAGCYVNALIDFWAQADRRYGDRINAALLGVQFVRDGERFGGGAVVTEDDFEAIPQAAMASGADSLF